MASIIAPKAGTYSDPKMYVSTGQLPPYVDPSEPPTKKSPWRQISQTPCINTATMILPAEFYDRICPKLKPATIQARCAKIFLKLEEILTGSFFTTYIKTPGNNILMLSEGTPGVDNVFYLRDGVLRLDLVKQDYQRAGLQGKPLKTSGGRKHVKEYFRVEIDLRAPSMVKGKKGFERLFSASQNALNQSLTWIFRDLSSSPTDDGDESAVITKHHPKIINIQPQTREVTNILVPDLISNPHQRPTQPPPVELLDGYYEIAEWLDLIALASPRVHQDDHPDPYISRYSPPGATDPAAASPQSLTVLTWTGLLDHKWLVRLLIEVIKQSRITESKHWLALTVAGHQTEAIGNIDGYTMLFRPGSTTQETSLDDEMDIDLPTTTTEKEMETEMETANDTTSEESKKPEDERKSHGGLQSFICFQFVDS